MESRQFRLKRIKSQIRLFVPLALMVLSLVFIGVGQFESTFLSQFKMALIDTVESIGHFLTSPIRWTQSLISGGSDLMHAYRQNKELLQEIDELKEWKNRAIQLQFEQEELKKLLNYIPPQKTKYVTAPVLLDNGEHFAQSLIVQSGLVEGISKGDVAMTVNGVLGRVVEVGPHMSRLMLLTDYSSRVPVVVGKSHTKGILAGDNGVNPKIISLPENQRVSVGDIVLTSGQVGVFPTGLPIGVVGAVEEGDIKVLLFERNQMPPFVRLVNFGLKPVLLPDNCMVEGSEK